MSGPSLSPILPTEPKDNKQWRCIQCNEIFPQSKLLETHAVDTDHKAYRCTKEKACGKLFILRPSWIRHERSHSAQKTHACSRCGKKFHRKDNCHDHERTCGRVARRARGASQSASTSPATCGTTGIGTPIDPPTTVPHGAGPGHATDTGYGGSKLFGTPDATIQEDNGHDDERAAPPVSRRLSAPPMSPPASLAAYFSPANTAPIQSRTASLQARIVDHPPSSENDTLPSSDNTGDHTTSRNIAYQSHSGSDWRSYYQEFQGPYDAPSPDLSYPEEYWGRPCATAKMSALHSRYENIRAAGNAHIYLGRRRRPRCRSSISTVASDHPIIHTGDTLGHLETSWHSVVPLRSSAHAYSSMAPNSVDFIPSDTLNEVVVHGAPATVSPKLSVPDQETVSSPNKDTNIPDSSEPKSESKPPSKMPELPGPKPRSKITIFFSKLKAYIKAPFRRHKH